MNQILLLAMCYILSFKKDIAKLTDAFPYILIYSNKLWKELYRFVYYLITKGGYECFW